MRGAPLSYSQSHNSLHRAVLLSLPPGHVVRENPAIHPDCYSRHTRTLLSATDGFAAEHWTLVVAESAVVLVDGVLKCPVPVHLSLCCPAP